MRNVNRARTSHLLIIASVAAIAAAAWIGCGVKSAPIPPEFAKPARIPDLEAVSAPGAIRLTWHRPMEHAGGGKMSDLASFTIERAADGGAFQTIGRVEVTDQGRFQVQHVFNFRDAAAAMGGSYRYQVISETSDGYLSDPSNIVTILRKKPAPPPNPANFALPTPVPLP
ncbi:MAG: hypothetical protein ACREQI_04470 [Candidatus Binataceae bacterium]